MKATNLFLLLIMSMGAFAQNRTAVSLFMRSDSVFQSEISEPTGDLYTTIGHHGPAIENEWMGLRIYFSDKAAIDVYNKAKPGLELEAAGWYPTPEEQKAGFGADYYKVGSTIGLGAVRLWDGEKVVMLNPVSNRTARVVKEANFSYMEMLSEGVPYLNDTVDILVRVTVYSGIREAKVEAFALCDHPVQFVTGINYHKNAEIYQTEGVIAVWGLHPEDVAAESVELGAAIKYTPSDYLFTKDDGSQFLLVSKPGKQLSTWISSACAREKEMNNLQKLVDSLK